MPGIVPARRSISSVDEEEQSNPSSDNGTPQPNKRARTTAGGDGRRTTNDSWRLDTPQTVSRQKRHAAPAMSGTTSRGSSNLPEHQPGAIVRVTLKNFVTYSNASFFPGPSLNMVIGPNGTGKSTLVCAICLGLGWSPKHLGRAKDVIEFIKHGADRATIEIELKGQPGKINPVIKRQIDRQKSGNHWWVNGQASTERNVRGVAETFNIQIDNLCQFLPQDRVAEFANLKPVEKLAATIRAAAPQHMTEEHERLKALRIEQKEAEKDILGQRSQMQNLEGRQNAQQADVERVREREQVLDEINFLELQRPTAEYSQALAVYKTAKVDHVQAQAELKKLEQEVEPSMRAVNEKEHYQEKVQKVLSQRQNLYQRFEQTVADLAKKKDELSRKLKDCDNKRESEKKAQNKRKVDIARIQEMIKNLENVMSNEPPEFDGPAYNEKIREKKREKTEVELKRRELDDRRDALREEFKQKEQRIEIAKREMDGLRTDVGQRGKLLQKTSDQVYRAWEWVKQHKDDVDSEGRRVFKDDIYGPALLECSIKDEKWAPAIESLFQQGELLAITCTNRDDFRTLSDRLHSQLNLPSVPLRTSLTPLNQHRPPIGETEMQSLGISGWALDYLEGPDAILSMLCNERQTHRTAVLQQEESETQFGQLTDSPVDAWLTINKFTRTTRRREYNAVSVQTRSVQREARFWVSQPIDHDAIANLQDNIGGWQSELEELRDSNKQCLTKVKEAVDTIGRLEARMREIEDEKAEKQNALTQFNALPTKLRTQKDKLADLQTEDGESHQRLADLCEEEGNHAIAKGQLAIDFSNTVQSLRQTHTQIVEAAIAHLEATSDVATLKARNADIERLLTEGRERVTMLEENLNRSKTEGLKCRKIMEKTWKDNAGLRDRIEALPSEERNRTPQELDLQVESKQARLELLHGGSASVIQEYEERARKIDRLRTQISTHDAKLAHLTSAITSIRSTWEPALDALIAQISDAFGAFFARIKCAGEVVVYKPSSETNSTDGADFENWAIHLRVKFRENEELSLLDSHRQSGGERAVSTMFYLMALQRLSKAPFRVVDEINQGMDPRNERVVHEMMVDIACGDIRTRSEASDEDGDEVWARGSQYFLITPKLLTNLKYKPGMKVHCIASGEFMPSEPGKLDLKRLIAVARRTSGTGVTAGDAATVAGASSEISVGA